MQTPSGQSGLLESIPWEKLRLFGERKSQFIEQLMPRTIPPIQIRDGGDTIIKDGQDILSIPYDANISFFVFREEILRELQTALKASEKKRDRLRKTIQSIYQNRFSRIKMLDGWKKFHNWWNIPEAKLEETAKELVANFVNGGLPQTWEELIALCLLQKKYRLLIETQTFDSFICTFLEILWGMGGDMVVHSDYSVEDPEKTKWKLFETFDLLREMIDLKVVVPHSTVEAEAIAALAKASKKSKESDWLFARQWYSTLTDLVTKKTSKGEYVWKPSAGVKLGLMEIPVGLPCYINARLEGATPVHYSCRGDWHLALLWGSENKELAVELLNNLMSSQKICERAFQNASVPTVRGFYEHFGTTKCLTFPQRPDIQLQDISFNELLKRFIVTAKSRSSIFDFHHCILEIHSVLEHVHNCPKAQPEELFKKIDNALAEIAGFKDKLVSVA
jgi:hypothetical protein